MLRAEQKEAVTSFLSDLFHGNLGNLGEDLSPKSFFSDTGKDFSKQPSWLKDLEIAAPLAIGTVLTAGADLPALAGAGGLADIFGGAGLAADTGAAVDLAATGGVDALGFAGDVGATTAGGGALSAIDAAAGGGAGLTSAAGGALDTGASLDLATAAGGGAGGGAWPAALDLGTATAGDVGATAGAPLSLGGATAAGGGAAAPGAGGIFSTIGAGLKTAAPFIGAAGLAGTLYQGYEQKQAQNALTKQEQQNATNAGNIAAQAQSIAAPLINQGTTLTGYLTSGTLPPQFQTQVDQTIASRKAGIIQGYASRGMSTNPQQNSQLQQDLAAVENSKNTLMTQLESQLSTAGINMINTANSLLAQGLAATQLESEIPIQISKLNEQLNKDMMTSISNFAAAMNGGRNITSAAA